MRRILRLLIGILGLAGAIQALAAPVPLPITGNLGAIQGTGQPYAGVSIQLQNCASPISIAGYFGIVQTGYQIRASSAGLITGSVWSNDLITCNGTTGNSQYSVTLMVGGTPSGTPQCYQVTSTQGAWNLNTQQPISCTNPPPNPNDAQYTNLNVTGCFSVDGGGCSSPTGGLISGQVANYVGLAGSATSITQQSHIYEASGVTQFTQAIGQTATNYPSIGPLPGSANVWSANNQNCTLSKLNGDTGGYAESGLCGSQTFLSTFPGWNFASTTLSNGGWYLSNVLAGNEQNYSTGIKGYMNL